MYNGKKISVVLTTYNGQKYIIEQLGSILKQTLLPDEILIYDDCSVDNTFSVINEYISNHDLNSVYIFRNSINLGWKANFIKALKNASGDYVFLSDQDDIWDSNKISTMIMVMENQPEISLLCTNYQILNEGNNQDSYNSIRDKNNDKSLKRITISERFHLVERPGCTYCIRKPFLDEILPLWIENYAHDQLLWIAAIVSEGLYLLNEPLITYRRYDGNASGKGPEKNRNKRSEKQKLDCIIVDRVYTKYAPYLNNNTDLIIKKYKAWTQNRVKALDNKSLFYWFKCFRYIHFYSSLKSYLGDAYCILFNKS